MTILITGGTGKTGAPLSQKLHNAGHTVLVASRSGNAPAPLKGVKFDWEDPSTLENPFNVDSNIDKVYIITPIISDRLASTKPFIDLAISKGVKRFVLMSATMTPPGGMATGKVHEYLAGLAGIEYAVLRPTWFFENFATVWAKSIREDGEVISATQEGKVPFISVDDITDAAFQALTAAKIDPPYQDLFIFGPDLLTHDQVVEILSAALGKKITHRKVTVDESAESRAKQGMPAEIAKVLASLDDYIAQGNEAKIVEEKNAFVGKVHFKDWVEKNKVVWSA